MSSTTDVPVARSVAAYAAAVRKALADLGPEQVEELTDGLEANLTDALADDLRPHGADLVEEFGEPAAYAAELRTAAGVDAVGGRPRRGLVAQVRALRAGTRGVLARARRRRWWPAVTEIVAALRPLLWVVRGWVAFQALSWAIGERSLTPGWWPTSPIAALLMLLCVVGSIQVGRGRWLRGRRLAPAVGVATAAALLATYPLVHWVQGSQRAAVALQVARSAVDNTPETVVELVPTPVDGVVVDGVSANNLFVYDANGHPLEGVQIYDDQGRPVRTVVDGVAPSSRPGEAAPWVLTASRDVEGHERWNVYPLLGWPDDELIPETSGGTPPEWAPSTPPFPFEKVPRIIPPTGAAGPADTADADAQADGDAQVAP